MSEENLNNIQEIDLWKKKLLDLGKRNNLVNFHDTKSSTLEIVLPSFHDAFTKVTTNSSIQVFDIKDDIDDESTISEDRNKLNRDLFINAYYNKVPKSQFLLFNQFSSTKKILKTLMKKSLESISERGVNILYIAFGFLKWKESSESNIEYKAPILMVPITIQNDSVTKPYFIKHFDEDISLNMTLQYLLLSQYGIEIPSFEDQDIESFLDELQVKVMNLGWEVIREAKISTFSFNKLHMYLDIENNAEKIANNPNVKAITQSELDENIFINNEEFDNVSNSRDLFIKQHNVVDADFSQTEAIEYALMGKSFVLQGPPGTGKSQTITNMIAELMYSGKKILFVSEKLAALEVVYNNLKKAKLSDYCLQLHSYKANKRDFIDDLYDTLLKSKIVVSGEASNNLEDLNKISNKLNDYDNELYKIRNPIYMSLYQLIGMAYHYSNTKELPFIIEDIQTLSKENLRHNCNLLKRYQSYEKVIGYNYKNHPLYGLVVNDNSFSFKLQLNELFSTTLNYENKLNDYFVKLKTQFNISLQTNNDAKWFIDTIKFCINNNFIDKRMLNPHFMDELLKQCQVLKSLNEKITSNREFIKLKYEEKVFDADCKSIYDDYIIYGSSFFKRLFNSKYKNAKTRLRFYRKNHKRIKYSEGLSDLQVIIEYKDCLVKFAETAEILKSFYFPKYNDLNTDWDDLILSLKKFKECTFNTLLKSGETLENINLSSISINDVNLLDNILCELEASENKLYPFLDSAFKELNDMIISDKLDFINRCINGFSFLDEWVEFNRLYSELKDNKILRFVDMVIDNNYSLNNIEDYYKLCFYRQWVDYILKENPKLNNYTRFIHEEDIKQFSFDDKKQLEISKAEINEKLSSKRPDPMLQMAGSPASVIMHEHEKRRNLKPIRILMKEIPSFIQELKPCFLMSPLSVSTFLPEDMDFDVVIFDEASQVFPEDAIVAIYRAKQLIVVGDSKQMPPTKFFMVSDNDDEEYDENLSDIDSFESILDLCSTTFPTKSLLCHYRSRDEGLINFSNKNFYNNNLVTYPSVYENKEDLGVNFIFVENGVMDSKTKINIPEAEKVVDLVFQHFEKYPNRSLGVVAFNIRQQDAILKLIDKRRLNNPSYENYFKNDKDEPFFVKNLETVQGDERDTIIFSITYAPNDKRQFALRFGPLNLIGGERRLNVAITRAKLNVKVVSSIHATDIDISRVTNIGPKLLHDYLDYAQKGRTALDSALSVNDAEEFDSPFEQDVYEFLKENGFDVTTQVGCSRYRIDIGLKRPNTSDYVLAIECDGASYHSSKSSRDRDRLRQSILERMNWKFYRIWSTDWYKNNAVEKKALIEACNKALESNSEYFETDASKSSTIDISDVVSTLSTVGSANIFDEYVKYNGKSYIDRSYFAAMYTEIEGPLSIDYFLKKNCNLWGYDRVTPSLKDAFRKGFRSNRVIKEKGFLYAPQQKNYAMRENAGSYLGDIDYISNYELRNGMYAAIEINIKCRKEALFTFIRQKLGFSRAGDKIMRKLEIAYQLLLPYIVIDKDDFISINPNNKLKIIHRTNQNLDNKQIK